MFPMESVLALLLLLPLGGGTFNALFGSRVSRRVTETVACGAIWGAFICAVALFQGFSGPLRTEYASWLAAFDFRAPLALHLDQLSLALCLMITFVCGLIHLYSIGYMGNDSSPARYFALLNIFVFAMLVLVLAENLPLLYLGWEGVGFCSYALIGFWYRDAANATAGRKAFIVTRIGDTAFGIAIVWMFQLLGTESISELNGMGSLLPAEVITALGLLLLIGAAGKSAQLPLSVWLPDAMAGPTPVSAQIHAATMVTAGVYLLARMYPLIGSVPLIREAIALTGGVTALYAATCACCQHDLKRILAYSTISQIGYMVLGVGAGALTAATFHLLTHAFFKALLFLGAGCVITLLHHEQNIFRMGGIARRQRTLYWTFLVGSLCLAGFPGSGGFFSKDAILAGLLHGESQLHLPLLVIGLLTALLTSFYTFRMFLIVFHGNPSADHSHPQGIVPRIMVWPLVPLALFSLFGGLLDLPSSTAGQGLLSNFLGAVGGFTGAHHAPEAELALQGTASLVSLAGLAAALARYTGRRRTRSLSAEESGSPLSAFLLNGWYLDHFYRLVLVRPFVFLSRLLWKGIDERGIDGAVNGLAHLVERTGRLPSSWCTGRVSTSLAALAWGLAAVLAYCAWALS